MARVGTTDPRIGTELAGYRIEELIGRGGMSTVYKAEDLTLRRKVALKLMSEELSSDESFRERFRAEWRLAASIDHPNVIPIHEAGESDGTLFIAMRYVEGTDLKELLKTEGVLEPNRAVALVSQAAAGLDAAHRRGLVHRDIKPSNVLIAKEAGEEHGYLADFGLTKPASSQEEAMASITLSGSSDYVSPEQIAEGSPNASSDIYSLGALLYETLTGQVPYPRDQELQTLWAHLDEPPPKPSEANPQLPHELDQVIAIAMAKEAEERYATGAELATAAQAALPTSRLSRRTLALLALLVAALVAAAIAVPAVLLTGGDGGQSAEPLPPLTEPAVVRIDPDSNQPVSRIEADISESDLIGVAEGSLWVMGSDKTLTQIDPETESVVRTVDLSALPGVPQFFTMENEMIWVSVTSGLRHEAVTGYDLSEETPTPRELEIDGSTVWLADGDLWMGEPDHLLRVDPATGETVAEIPYPTCESNCDGFALSLVPGEIWVSYRGPTGDNSVLQIDTATNQIVQSVDLDFEYEFMWPAEDGLWLLDQDTQSVTRVDSDTQRIARIPVNRDPEFISRGEGALWVTHPRDGVVARIDPETLDQTVIDVGGRPTQIDAGAGGVWVMVFPEPVP